MADNLDFEVVAGVDGFQNACAADLGLVHDGFAANFPNGNFGRVTVFERIFESERSGNIANFGGAVDGTATSFENSEDSDFLSGSGSRSSRDRLDSVVGSPEGKTAFGGGLGRGFG